MKKNPTLPSEPVFGGLTLGIAIQWLGLILLLVSAGNASLLHSVQLRLWIGSIAALLFPAIFPALVLHGAHGVTPWFRRGKWAPARRALIFSRL